jgi:putative ABC transport system ATP-binding protein
MASILSIENLYKTFQNGSKEVKVLDNINFSVEEGDSLSIVGASGSGKTTLLGLCAGLDKPSYGNIILRNTVLNKLSEDELAQIRNQYVGFIFQNFQLIPTLTALENVMVPLELQAGSGIEQSYIKSHASELLDRVGLADRLDHYPTQLSGGEQQRVAIARAFSNKPKILFADEPTGNLDEETSTSIEALLFNLNKEQGTTLILVTHDIELAAKTNHILRLKGGKVID